jgi:CRP-like cAMP-binding protein
VPFASTLSDAEREEIARLMKRQNYSINDTIIKQGDSGDIFFVIESGEVKFTAVDQK